MLLAVPSPGTVVLLEPPQISVAGRTTFPWGWICSEKAAELMVKMAQKGTRFVHLAVAKQSLGFPGETALRCSGTHQGGTQALVTKITQFQDGLERL